MDSIFRLSQPLEFALTQAHFFLCAIVLVGCVLLGGNAGTGFLSDSLLQLVSIPLALFSVWQLQDLPPDRRPRWTLVFCLALVLVPLLQLVPLPPAVWTALPNRQAAVATFELLDRELPWLPLSLSPQATWLSALSLLPPIAVFLGTLVLGYRQRRRLSLVLLGVGIVSVVVGLSQVAQGPNSSLRFYQVTNPGEAVGFFANRNHFAAFLYCLTILAAAWMVEVGASFAAREKSADTRQLVMLVASFTVLVMLVAAQAMARSRAGLGLTIVALLGGMALAFSDRRTITGVTPARLLLGAIALALMFGVQFALYRVLERFTDDPLADARITFVGLTMAAAKSYLPFGSGVGTFVPVYAAVERPEHALIDTYVNRAHNDVAEVSLEAGVVGVALLAVFLFWLGASSLRLWRGNIASSREIDLALARGAALVVTLLIVHSFVDYPLRTAAMMAVMAFACALLIDPPAGVGDAADADNREETLQRDAAFARQPAPRWRPPLPSFPDPAPVPAGAKARRPAEPWGSGLEWPEEWRQPGTQRPAPAAPRRARADASKG